MLFDDKTHLRIPGPTPIPPRVTRAMQQPMVGHRSEEASQLLIACSNKLKPVFGTQNQQPLIQQTPRAAGSCPYPQRGRIIEGESPKG